MASILQSLHIDGTLLIQAIDFILLFAFLRIFAWPPLVAAMEKRRAGIEEQLSAAENERQQAVALREQQQRDLEGAKAQAQAIVERAQKAAAEEARQLLEDARQQAERMRKQVRDEISRERDAAVGVLRNEVADLVLTATGKLLRTRLDAAQDRRLVEEFIATAGAEAGSQT